MLKVSLFGAGGKMGNRITDNLRCKEYELLFVEASDRGIQNLINKGLHVTPEEEALLLADVIVLAVPDVLKIGRAHV